HHEGELDQAEARAAAEPAKRSSRAGAKMDRAVSHRVWAERIEPLGRPSRAMEAERLVELLRTYQTEGQNSPARPPLARLPVSPSGLVRVVRDALRVL